MQKLYCIYVQVIRLFSHEEKYFAKKQSEKNRCVQNKLSIIFLKVNYIWNFFRVEFNVKLGFKLKLYGICETYQTFNQTESLIIYKLI